MPERLTTEPVEVARARTLRALQTVERAQRLCGLYARVQAGWRSLDDQFHKARTLTLDPLNAASLKRDGGVQAVLRPHSEQLDCPGTGGRPCPFPVRSRYEPGPGGWPASRSRAAP